MQIMKLDLFKICFKIKNYANLVFLGIIQRTETMSGELATLVMKVE